MKWPSSINQNEKLSDGMVTSTFGRDVESVAFAVLLFLFGGLILFISCFFVTKCLQCYKARQRRLRRKALGEDDDCNEDDDDEITSEIEFEDDTSPCHVQAQPELLNI